MSTITKEFTKEQLIERLRHWIAVAAKYPGLEQAQLDAAIFKIALASLEAEAVADVVAWSSPNEERTCDVRLRRHDINPGPLYTAPPAPVSVPDAMEMDDDFDSAFEHGKAVGWNACRAAMLQGAEPVTTDYKLPFDQWLSQQTGTIDVECGCVMTEVFFHWLRVAYEAGNSPVIPDGWVACSERMPEVGSKVIVFRPSAEESNDPPVKTATYKGGREYYHGFDCYCEPTHWMPLPAAPQQEVK